METYVRSSSKLEPSGTGVRRRGLVFAKHFKSLQPQALRKMKDPN